MVSMLYSVQEVTCVQSNKGSTITKYDSRVVRMRKLPILLLKTGIH